MDAKRDKGDNGGKGKAFRAYRVRQDANPDNRFEAVKVEWEDGVELPQTLKIHREIARSIVSENDSPDIPFRYSVNPYRGCAHACAYCYARPSHEYLGLGAGTDFETQIYAKTNAAELLRKKLASKSWTREPITFSGVTDCYQPAESGLKLTRACLEVCLEFKQPVSIITKSTLVLRDLDLLTALDRVAGAGVVISIPFADEATARLIEPFAAASRTALPGPGEAVPGGLADRNLPGARSFPASTTATYLPCWRAPRNAAPVSPSTLCCACPEACARYSWIASRP